jgi:outer membrane protein OmpA-like peptidoglycan-associated protein
MKKLFLMLAIAGMSVASMAQDADPTEKYSVATNSFWSNWFVSADVAYGAFYSNEEQGMSPKLSKSPFKGFRNNIGASVAIGKWFTPGFGLRTKATGIWGRNVQSDNKKTNAVKFWNISEQAMFNLSNMFCGYSDTRVWNFIPYAGAGVLRNMSHNYYAMTVSAGIVNTWKLSKHFLLNLDLGYTFAPDYDAFRPANGAVAANYGDGMKNCDRFFTAEIGLTYNLGKTGWNKTPDVEAIKALSQGQIDALNAQLSDAQAENARLKNMLANQPKPTAATVQTVTETKVVAAPVSVFFNIGQSKFASQRELQNVSALTKIAKENNSKILVTGYADSSTGSAKYNQKLSQKRADAVVAELVKMGIKRENIEVKAAGGVDTLTPPLNNRRATIEIK